MENLSQLHAKLDRAQAEIDKGVGDLVQHRAFMANRIARRKDVTESRELLEMLEDTHLLNVQHRDRLWREMDLALARKNGSAFGAAALLALAKPSFPLDEARFTILGGPSGGRGCSRTGR